QCTDTRLSRRVFRCWWTARTQSARWMCGCAIWTALWTFTWATATSGSATRAAADSSMWRASSGSPTCSRRSSRTATAPALRGERAVDALRRAPGRAADVRARSGFAWQGNQDYTPQLALEATLRWWETHGAERVQRDAARITRAGARLVNN